MPLTIRVNCPHCNHAGIRVGEPGHVVNTRPTGFYVDPTIQCPSCAGPFVVRGSRALAKSRVHPPPDTRLPDAPSHSTPPPKMKATATTPPQPTLSFREAQAACKARGLPATGKHDQLLARLAAHNSEMPP